MDKVSGRPASQATCHSGSAPSQSSLSRPIGESQAQGDWAEHPAVVALLARGDERRAEEEVDEAVLAFVRESNRIESIANTTSRHYSAHWQFLRGAIHIPALVELVSHLQPDARFRNSPEVPGVRVGNHIAPPSGPQIEADLRRILAMRDPWEQHVAYETLHPFTDGNGRSGRAIWLHRHYHETDLDPWAIRRGFLHSFYYQSLAGVRLTAQVDERR